jgi:hypothetical protein
MACRRSVGRGLRRSAFFEVLGLREIRRRPDEKGRYTNVFLAAPGPPARRGRSRKQRAEGSEIPLAAENTSSSRNLTKLGLSRCVGTTGVKKSTGLRVAASGRPLYAA